MPSNLNSSTTTTPSPTTFVRLFYHRAEKDFHGKKVTKKRVLPTMTVIEFDSISRAFAFDHVVGPDGKALYRIKHDEADYGAMTFLLRWINSLPLPFSPSYKGVKYIPVKDKWSIKQVAQIYQAASLLHLKAPVSVCKVENRLYKYLKSDDFDATVLVDIWTCTEKTKHLEQGKFIINKSANDLFTSKFGAVPGLLEAYQQRREKHLKWKAACQKRAGEASERKAARKAEKKAMRDLEAKKAAFASECANRRGVTTSLATSESSQRVHP